MKKILGVDWGSAKIGLAISEEEAGFALHFGTLPNDHKLEEKIAAIIEREEVGDVVIGAPIHKNLGEETKKQIEEFAQKLSKKTKARMHFENEMFTTKMAQNLIAYGIVDASVDDHQEAARLILEAWLGRNHSQRQKDE